MREKPVPQTITHAIPPVWDENSRILILGTMPSPKSREAGFFYMHAQNRFWPVLFRVFGEEPTYRNNDSYREKRNGKISSSVTTSPCGMSSHNAKFRELRTPRFRKQNLMIL